MSKQWISVNEAADLTGYHPEHIRRLIRKGAIKAQKFSIVWQVDRDSLLGYAKGVKKGRPKSPEI
jgi:excisionase family DNA binding protein